MTKDTLLDVADYALRLLAQRQAEGENNRFSELKTCLSNAAHEALQDAEDDEMAVYKAVYIDGLTPFKASEKLADILTLSAVYRLRRQLLYKVKHEIEK